MDREGGAVRIGICGSSSNNYDTNETIKGELNLKKFDEINQIASGIFWFDAVNSSGQKFEVREGRFDVRYTK